MVGTNHKNTFDTVGLTDAQLRVVTNADPELIRIGYQVVEKQKKESFREAWRNHWRAACWSIFLTSALFMEGYDTAVVSGNVKHSMRGSSLPLTDQLVFRSSVLPQQLWHEDFSRQTRHTRQLPERAYQHCVCRSVYRPAHQWLGTGALRFEKGFHLGYGFDDTHDLFGGLRYQSQHATRCRASNGHSLGHVP